MSASTAIINGMTLTTQDCAISVGKIDLILHSLGEDLSSVIDKIDTSSLVIGNVFADLETNFLPLILTGSNTITILNKTVGQTVDAGAGNDTVKGNGGDDTLNGGSGSDKLTGGKGADTFVFNLDDFDFANSQSVGVDTVTDFKQAEGDKLNLSSFGVVSLFNTLAAANAAGAGETLIYAQSTGKFYYDADGVSADPASEAAVVIITLTGKPVLVDADFVV